MSVADSAGGAHTRSPRARPAGGRAAEARSQDCQLARSGPQLQVGLDNDAGRHHAGMPARPRLSVGERAAAAASGATQHVGHVRPANLEARAYFGLRGWPAAQGPSDTSALRAFCPGTAHLPLRFGRMYRFRNRGAEYMSESGVKWMSGSAKRQCDPEPYPGRRWVERAVNKARLQELGARVAARGPHSRGRPAGESRQAGPEVVPPSAFYSFYS